MVFQWSPSFLDNFNSAIALIVSTLPLISNSSCHFSKPITKTFYKIGIIIIIILMFHIFFSSLIRCKSYKSFLLFFIAFHSMVQGKSRIYEMIILSSFLINKKPIHILSVLGDLFYESKFPRFVRFLFFGIDFGLCIFHLVLWSNLHLLHNSQSMISNQWCVVLYSICASLEHLLLNCFILVSIQTRIAAPCY